MQKIIILLISCLAWTTHSLAAGDEDSPIKKRLGSNVTFLSHYVENGLSQSDNLPAVQASAAYSLNNFVQIGLWGSNTNYNASSDHFNLRAFFNLNVFINPTTTAFLFIQ